VVLPHAAPGIVSGALLAMARAAGETAPLLFTIGAAQSANWDL
jgi:phosphate transport system permease protein